MRFAGVLVLLLAACGQSEPPNEAACPHQPGADRSDFIRVTGGFPPTVLRRDLDLAGLAVESGGAGGGRPQGLTSVGHQLRYRSLVNAETARGRTCLWFDQVSVDLTPSSIQIFIPKEYPERSCEYDAILAHEREHVRVHAERLTVAVSDIRASLEAATWLPARGNPLETGDREAAQKELEAKIRRVVEPVHASYKGKLALAQADLDRPDLYQWVSKRCSSWK